MKLVENFVEERLARAIFYNGFGMISLREFSENHYK